MERENIVPSGKATASTAGDDKWKYCVLVRQDGLTQGGESLRRDTPYSTPAAQTTYLEVESQSL